MKENLVLLDGAVGTSLWEKAGARGLDRVPVWKYNITCPEAVIELAREYLDDDINFAQYQDLTESGITDEAKLQDWFNNAYRIYDEMNDEVYHEGGLYKDIFDASARSMNVDKIANVMDGEAGE